MNQRRDTYTVTHNYASDPDPRKVEAALEAWKLGLAEQATAGAPSEQKPIAHIEVGPRARRVKRSRAGGENRNV